MLLHNHHQRQKEYLYISQRPRDFREVLNEPPIKTGMTKQTSYTFYVLGTWYLFNSINLCFVNFNTSLGNLMSHDNAFINHKVTLFPIQDETSVFASLQNSIKVAQTIIKRGSINGEVIHEYLTNLFTKIREYSHHASLKGSRCIT